MIPFVLALWAKPVVRKVVEYGGVALVMLLLVIWLKPDPKPVIITQTTEKTVTVQVPVEKLVLKDVVKYVEDTANVERLLAENASLKIKVQQLSETIASHKVLGAGEVTEVPTETVPDILKPDNPVATVTRYKDWRLDFVHDGTNARYELTQKFEVLSTTGRNKDGVPVHLVKLFEIGPDGQRLPIPDTKTVSLFADDATSKWHLGLTVQAGAGYTLLDSKPLPGGVVAVQWLKRGKSEAAEDAWLSLFSPALFLSDGAREAGILPLSVNVGRKLPVMKDLWVSPFVGFTTDANGKRRYGIFVMASF